MPDLLDYLPAQLAWDAREAPEGLNPELDEDEVAAIVAAACEWPAALVCVLDVHEDDDGELVWTGTLDDIEGNGLTSWSMSETTREVVS